MSEKWNDVITYFRPPANYFWKWTDAGNVIEWREGDTICYREDLTGILKKLTREGWPPLGAILLVLSACRGTAADDRSMLDAAKQLLNFFDKHRNRFEILAEQKSMMGAIRFLEQVASLPVELRSGAPRVWLLYVIFKNTPAKIEADRTARYLNVFNSGIIDRKVFEETGADQSTAVIEWLGDDGEAVTIIQNAFKEDIDWLKQASQIFPTAKELEQVVRTGIPELPAVPGLELPVQDTEDLLVQLERDPKTTGLAQLTHRLIAALNIPLHAHGSSDQSFGGVSDITNRGNLDRLLLSELAHDDLSLMARLANNEALYLRREELPSNPEKQRILLIDTTIKMWGLPRVFAISAALACAHNNKAKAQILSYALSGNSFTDVDLSTKEGVVSSLEQLDAALHCGRALTLFMNQAAVREEDEVFLITEEEATHSMLFQSMLASLKKPLSFLVTVNRNGQLQFYEYINGRRKQLSEAKFDLQELLFPANKNKNVAEIRVPGDLPAIMQEDPCPLFFPASKIKYNTECFYEFSKDEVACVTIDQRVLYWSRRTRGAREIIQYLEPGRFCFGTVGTMIYVLVYAGITKYCRLYEVNLELNSVEITKLPETLTLVTEMAFDAGLFYIKANDNLYAVGARSGTVSTMNNELSTFDSVLQKYKNKPSNLNYFKRLVNDGYTTINTVKSVYINHNGDIGFDDRHIAFMRHRKEIVINHNRHDKHKSMRIHNAKEVDAGITHANIRFSKFVWNDGSEVLIDSRGLMHLRSADKTLPEITIVMIMGKPTACWAADGRVCGPPYFTGVDDGESRDVTGFYYNYIQRFIDTLEKHGTIA